MPENTLSTVKQCSETKEYLFQKTVVKTSFIGEDEAINTLASQQKKGTAFSGLSTAIPYSIIDSSITEKIQADRTKWTVTYSIYTPKTKPGGGGGGEDDSPYYVEKDSMTMAQYQFPLYKYLLSNEAAAVRSWELLAGNDISAKQNFQYRDEADNLQYLSAVSAKALETAKKMAAGIEYVQKSYPIMTHTEQLSARRTMTTRLEKLNHIDDSIYMPSIKDSYPNFQWLKTQFDWVENDDSSWTLTESWMGTPEDQPWDKDLYGLSAWKFVDVSKT